MATPKSVSKGNRKGTNSALHEAIKNVVNASGQTSRQRNIVQLTLDIQTIETKAKESGLPAHYFEQIVNVAASKKLAETTSSKLIKTLIPETVVPEEAVVKAISWMCTNTPSINIQALLIRWINLVFDSIDGKEKLHSLYGILFYFLDSDTLMPHVCHLLYQLTQREDVRLFRVRHLLTLQAAVGPQPYLMGLLSLYKLFYPNLVTMALPRQRRVYFRQTDRLWASDIRRVKEKNRSLDEVPVDMDTTRLLIDQSLSSSGRAAKRPRLEIPGVSTKTDVGRVHESSNVHTSLDRTPLPFSHVKDFTELAENIDIVEMPGQIATVLQHPLLQHAVSCHRSPITAARFSMWLQHALLEEFINSPDVTEEKHKEQLLNLILKYSNFLQEGIPACERFLERYLASWNGQDFKNHVFELIAKYRMCPFGRLKENILEPIRCLFFSSSVYFKCQVILSLTNLLSNYIRLEWKRFSYKSGGDNSESVSTTTEKQYSCLFEEEVEEFTPRHTIHRLVTFIDCMCCIGLLVEAENSLLMNFILAFYERVCTMYRYSVPLICLPSPGIFYQALFGMNAMSISRVCALLCLYKDAFSTLKSSDLPLSSEEMGTNQIDQFNVYLTDTATSLWQYKAFQSPRQESTFNIDPEILNSVEISHPDECLSIHSHQALLGFVIRFLEETQPEGSVVHPNSIKASQNTKQVFLRFLQKMDVQGIVDFIGSFIRKRSRAMGDKTSEITTGVL